eukprot:CAMPEP_0202899200 /NCGR_PEP_ID=MMETSP1392-20130828/7497_1 /ASSEMBLY_ACC=CAM_ASM_000868 /TAXON_ID=225041 /ORGANISM="Chlamydomonas chlamydogama, Strain SAG 11-48b" /LENGTH=116 /DNA_ID=CAMNT_0049585321 /DNA_START=85 /DNA_END=435 /DNA_ORIENTATION=+
MPPGYAPAAVWVPPQPVPGVPIKPPRVPPSAGQVVVAYEITEPDVGCCQCSDLNSQGLIALIVLILLFWPLAFLPCVMAECHEKSQRPVYGFPPEAGAPPPMAMPVAAPAGQYAPK